MAALDHGDTSRPRIIYRSGHVEYHPTNRLAYAAWLALARGVRAAMRTAGELDPVYAWDCVDRR